VIKRFWDIVAPMRPARPERGYRRVLSWAALPVTNRRWAAPLCALALGFGLFAGIAISPGTSGSRATAPQIIALAGTSEEGEAEEPAAAEEGGFEEPTGEEESFPEASEEFFEEPFEEEAPPEETFDEEPLEEEPVEDPAGEPEEETQTLSGVVVHANPAAGSYTLVESGGLLTAVHAAKLPAPGTKVEVPARILANGTNAEAGARQRTGTKRAASISGIVTFVNPDPAAPSYAVSKRGVSLLVRVHPDPTGAVPPLPVPGAFATVEVDVEAPPPPAAPLPLPPGATAPVAPPVPSCAPDPAAPAPPAPVAALWQRTIEADGAPFASSDIAGVVMGICPGQLLLSGDDMREAGKDMVVTVPGSIDVSALKPGDSIAATAEIEAGGVLKLTGLASDERTKGADDADATQGELIPQETK
jgi:hypothetical protein